MAEVPVREEPNRPGGIIEVDEQLVEDISSLVASGQQGMVLNLVADLYPVDLALLLTHLSFDRAYTLFHWLPVEDASEVLADLDSTFRTQLLEESPPEHVATLLDELDTDDATDILAELPEALTQQVLPELEDAEELRELLAYNEDTAGGIMATEYVAVPVSWNVAEVTEEVRRKAESVEPIYAVYVTDAEERLVGAVSLTRLLLSPARTAVREIMETDYIAVGTDVDQEEVARIMERYDLATLPVVDDEGRLVGRITIDDVVDVIREEAEEDIQIMSGAPGGEEHTDSVLRISRGRLPWLFAGLVGTGLSATVVGSFEATLEQAVVLAFFMPIITAMGGNAGVQSAAIAVQGLSSGELWIGDMVRRILKEFGVALVNGAVLATALGTLILAMGLGDAPRLALTVGLSLFSVILLATTNGALVPFLLKRLDVDPASAMGPFVTTLNDIVGLTVYFVIASVLYL